MKPTYQRPKRVSHDPDFAGRATGLSKSLLDLHAALLEVARGEYEREHGRQTPVQMYELLLGSPEFVWLRPLSGFVARFDDLLATESDRGPYRTLIRELEEMISLENLDSPFARRYAESLQVAAVATAHGAARQKLKAFAELLHASP